MEKTRRQDGRGWSRRVTRVAWLVVAALAGHARAQPAPTPGACCLLDGTCVAATTLGGQDCIDQNGVYQGDDTTCVPAPCPVPGACCLPDGSCDLAALAGGSDCVAQGGVYLGDDTTCTSTACDQPGWNWVDNAIVLTKNEPAWWAASSGQPKGVSPFTVLDPVGPGRPDPEGSGDRVLRGFIVAWAVDHAGREIRWNHLKGDVTTVDYRRDAAWEHNAWSFPVVAGVANGEPTGDAGTLNLDGTEYVRAFDMLLIDFWSVGERTIGGVAAVAVDTDLTLMPVSVDLRQETAGPVTTKAFFSIWNQNEVKFSGLDRCITCWDQARLSRYEAPNHFLEANLQTDKGRARIDGISSLRCNRDNDPNDGLPIGADPRDLVSEDAALLGVIARHLRFLPGGATSLSGGNVHGLGTQDAVIRFDPLGLPPEATAPIDHAQQLAARGAISATPPTSTRTRTSVGTAPGSGRVSATAKGSLLIFPKIELRWSPEGMLVQDAFVDISNDYPEDVEVQLYFVNGDPAN